MECIVNECMHEIRLHSAERHAAGLVQRYHSMEEASNEIRGTERIEELRGMVHEAEMIDAVKAISNYLRDSSEQYKSPILDGLISEMKNIANKHKEQLESAVDNQLYQHEIEIYENLMTGLINDYQNEEDGSIEAIFEFLAKRKRRCVALNNPTIDSLVESLENIVIKRNE